MKLKICGMHHNIAEVAALQPDYLGFIFYKGSKRNYTGEEIPDLPGIKKVGVFVDASIEEVIDKTRKFRLDVIQLHGDESTEFCKNLKIATTCAFEVPALSGVEVPALSGVDVPALSGVEVWKVFSIKDHFNFSIVKPYENIVDAFLFDTKGPEKGGNGYTFNWDVLRDYPSQTPFVLSGGIGLEEISAVKEIQKTKLPIMAIDVNSKFETAPGLKNIETIRTFLNETRNNEQ